jgi:hypothetical protein
MRAHRMSILCIPDNATGIPAAARVSDIKALDRGLSDIDHPIAISISYMWDLPKLRNGNSALKFVVNGWSLSGLISTGREIP